jgi:hypothetical protein
MRRFDSKPITALTAAGLSVVLGVASCGHSEVVVVQEGQPPPAAFSPADASAEAAVEVIDVPMCPVTTCTLPWATCPSSRFPCDANLLSDDENCGGCGLRCAGADTRTFSQWTCVEGRCAFSCLVGRGRQNCDGDPTNGCEAAVLSDASNCGTCGNACTDGLVCYEGKCVDPCVRAGRPDRCGTACVDLATDDRNCKTCGTVCDRTDPSLPALQSDMYYGCSDSKCGAPKCKNSNKRDCNKDLSDGCETSIYTDENCSDCGDACPEGKTCRSMPSVGWTCVCNNGETLCASTCVRLDDDPDNCGGCGRVCAGRYASHFSATCSFGVCGGQCHDGYADCDTNTDNGCEVDTRIDNRNCGGCGNACLPNQVCSQGVCLTAPCDAGPTGVPTK